MLRKIFYQTKNTMANTTYYEIPKEDHDFLMEKCIQIQCYFGEISLAKDRDIKDLVKWYTSPNKTLPFSNQFKRNNSPQSFVSGMLNNMLYNGQRDLSESQASHLENIISVFSQLTEVLNTENKISLQKTTNNDTVLFVENIISFNR